MSAATPLGTNEEAATSKAMAHTEVEILRVHQVACAAVVTTVGTEERDALHGLVSVMRGPYSFRHSPDRVERPAPRGIDGGESACKRDFVVPSTEAKGAGDHPSNAAYPRVVDLAAGGRAAHALCLALLRVGFTEPCESPHTLVRSYRTVAPLPVAGKPAHRRSLSVALPSGRPDLAHASTLPYGVPTFLDTVEAVPRPPGRLTANECRRLRRVRRRS